MSDDKLRRFRVVRLDYWEYRRPTGWVFSNQKEAQSKAAELMKANLDPLNSYFVDETKP